MLLYAAELPTYYAPAANMQAEDVKKYLDRANGYCLGYIGGLPPVLDWDTDQENLKGVVALAFEILAEGETAQTDPTNGNITEAAPSVPFTRSDRNANPLGTVDKMLMPYKAAYNTANAPQSDYGVAWLGGMYGN